MELRKPVPDVASGPLFSPKPIAARLVYIDMGFPFFFPVFFFSGLKSICPPCRYRPPFSPLRQVPRIGGARSFFSQRRSLFISLLTLIPAGRPTFLAVSSSLSVPFSRHLAVKKSCFHGFYFPFSIFLRVLFKPMGKWILLVFFLCF